MMSYFLSSFFQLAVIISLISLGLYTLHYLLGYLKEGGVDSQYKRHPYSGGKSVETRASYFKATFFQYAIYFLIFDVVAFVIALYSFTDPAELSGADSWGKVTPPVIYLIIVLLLFFLLPKHEGEIM